MTLPRYQITKFLEKKNLVTMTKKDQKEILRMMQENKTLNLKIDQNNQRIETLLASGGVEVTRSRSERRKKEDEEVQMLVAKRFAKERLLKKQQLNPQL